VKPVAAVWVLQKLIGWPHQLKDSVVRALVTVLLLLQPISGGYAEDASVSR
jgi:hypothetical protein